MLLAPTETKRMKEKKIFFENWSETQQTWKEEEECDGDEDDGDGGVEADQEEE